MSGAGDPHGPGLRRGGALRCAGGQRPPCDVGGASRGGEDHVPCARHGGGYRGAHHGAGRGEHRDADRGGNPLHAEGCGVDRRYAGGRECAGRDGQCP